jgi:hypothetical protein
MSRRAIAIFSAFVAATSVAVRSQPPASPPTVLRITAQEVLLDFIARDKHEKLVTNLHQEDVAGVFTLKNRLALLQQYTDDADLLNKAVDRAMRGAYTQYGKAAAGGRRAGCHPAPRRWSKCSRPWNWLGSYSYCS